MIFWKKIQKIIRLFRIIIECYFFQQIKNCIFNKKEILLSKYTTTQTPFLFFHFFIWTASIFPLLVLILFFLVFYRYICLNILIIFVSFLLFSDHCCFLFLFFVTFILAFVYLVVVFLIFHKCFLYFFEFFFFFFGLIFYCLF